MYVRIGTKKPRLYLVKQLERQLLLNTIDNHHELYKLIGIALSFLGSLGRSTSCNYNTLKRDHCVQTECRIVAVQITFGQEHTNEERK